MRIGVDYRMLSAGKNTVNRGMGRYTQQQIREALRLDSQNDYVLLCNIDADETLILPEIRSAPNVQVARYTPSPPWTKETPNPTEHVLRLSEQYQEWIYRQHIDIYHATTPFLFKDLVLPHFNVCPVVATFYDLIPLIFPHEYLPPNAYVTELYGRALQFVTNADRLITISQSACDDAIDYLGVPQERIDIAYPVADPGFRELPPDLVRANLQSLRKRINLPDHYLLCVTYPHHSKNVERMLEGYALLDPSVRRRLPLVLTFELSGNDRERVWQLTERYGVTENVLLTDFVSESELVALYNGALALLHVSRYEGFGLPVVEAMRCGTPVITSTSSSLPEVGGDAAILVDPDDVHGIAHAIQTVYGDPAQRQHMRERGHVQAAQFSPDQLGRMTLEGYLSLRPNKSVANDSVPRQRLALWTPLPPQKSGIADYSADLLLSGLSHLYDLEIFVDDGFLPRADLLGRYAIQHHSAFGRRNLQQPFDVILYQMGSSFFHLYMYDYLQQYPGVVVLHDLLWSNTLYWRAWHAGRMDDFRRELRDTEGDTVLAEFERIYAKAGGSFNADVEEFFSRHYMLKHVVEKSRAVVVHCDLFEDEIRSRHPGIPTSTILLGMEDMWQGGLPLQTQLVREQLGLRPETFIAGIFGIVDRVKRVDVAIRAFHQLHRQQPDSYLLIVGQQLDTAYVDELRDLAHHLGLLPNVLFIDYPEKSHFDALILACDVVINLRYPSRKQMSAALMRGVSAGKPIIITNLPEWGFLPSSFCLRVAPDEHEVSVLADHLIRLASDPALRDRLSLAARSWYVQEGTIPHMIERYHNALLAVAPRAPSSTQDTIEQSAHIPALTTLSTIEDFTHPQFKAAAREVYSHELAVAPDASPKGLERPELWATTKSFLTLRTLEALRPDAVVLHVGAGTSPLLFALANHSEQVFAVDWYLDSSTWDGPAPRFMLYSPEIAAPPAAQIRRIVAQHMEPYALRFPDSSFDVVVCTNVLEHCHSLTEVAGTAYELGRVLKPGGILSITTQYRISGPPGGSGWDSYNVFSAEEIERSIVEATGLELLEQLRTDLSTELRVSRRNISLVTGDNSLTQPLQYRRRGEAPKSIHPHLISVHNGYAYCTIHLTLRKTKSYPLSDNNWARLPPEQMRRSVQNDTPRSLLATLTESPRLLRTDVNSMLREQTMTPSLSDSQRELREVLADWERLRLRGFYNRTLNRLPRPISYVVRTIDRVLVLGRTLGVESRLFHKLIDGQVELLNASAHTASTLTHLEAQALQMADGLHALRQQDTKVTGLTTKVEQQANLIANLLEQNARLTEQVDRLNEDLLTAMKSQIEDMHRGVSDVDQRHRRLVSDVRVLQQHIESSNDSLPRPTQSSIDDIDVRWLLQNLEQELPELRSCRSIELSIQDGAAEVALSAGAAYLGERLAAAAETYQLPNDLWYHIDFTPDWSRPMLFESARMRLPRGGVFVLVTEPAHVEAGHYEGLELIHNTRLTLISGKVVRAYMWRRQ
jgi:glycosyltransferase involved in cell wall biosynthesis/SAM-dependent methyltransferase